jgi:hypothetical protein
MAAISQRPFVIFSCVYAAGAIVLAILSETSASQKWVFVDIGMCALFGAIPLLGLIVIILTTSRRIHSVINKSFVDVTNSGMVRDVHELDYISCHLCQ